jgi:HAD superfamily hydrolase (TIGR01509 family)
MKGKYGALWDLDGVLADTAEIHFQAWSRTLPAYGIPFAREQFRQTFGMNNAGILGTLLGDVLDADLISEISEEKERLFRAAAKGHARPLPGVREWLIRLQDWGFKQAIASSAPPANIDALAGELGIASYFAANVSGYDLPGKPDPAVFLKAAGQIGVPPLRCVVFEDAIAGVEAAKRAGMKCVAVTTTNPAQDLNAADLVVERLDNLAVDALERWVRLA